MPIVTVNSFLEDTCVLVASAFLFVRGPLERLLANPLWSGLIFGLLGASEAVFPNARFPYATHTLACAFACLAVGWRAGSIAAMVALLGSAALRGPSISLVAGLQMAITVALLSLLSRPKKLSTLLGPATVMIAQDLLRHRSSPSGSWSR